MDYETIQNMERAADDRMLEAAARGDLLAWWRALRCRLWVASTAGAARREKAPLMESVSRSPGRSPVSDGGWARRKAKFRAM